MAKKTKTPAITYTPPVKVSAEDRKGPSTVPHPVAVTWVTCLTTAQASGDLPKRSDLMAASVDAGVGYNTARTQVQKFRKWYNDGQDPAGLPKGITIA